MALADNSAHATGSYPGVKREGSDILDLEYKEGIMVGYRWHDTKKVKPLFAFGHGLSYTDFAYGDVKADCKEMTSDGSMTFRIPVTNKGSVPGAETVQLYISDPKCSVTRPQKNSKASAKYSCSPARLASLYSPSTHRPLATSMPTGTSGWPNRVSSLPR